MKRLLIWETNPVLRLVMSSRQLMRSSSPSRFVYSTHSHPFYELGLVLTGECAWRLGRRTLTLNSGQVVLIKARSRHREEPSSDRRTELAWIGFDFPGIAPSWSEQVVSLGEASAEVELLFQAIYREHSATDPLTRRRVSLALQNALVLVSRCAESADSTPPTRKSIPRKTGLNTRQIRSIEASAHYFRHNFQESLSIAQVAAYHSFCPPYFSTLFRRHYRMSPRTFLHKVKLEKAAELLQTSDLTLKEIGARCGFVDAAHLSKAFKQAYHRTPRAFRLESGSRRS
jgi:AraC-like DNA-binding protein